MRFGMAYQDPSADHYEQQCREHVLNGLRRQATELGFAQQAVEGVTEEGLRQNASQYFAKESVRGTPLAITFHFMI